MVSQNKKKVKKLAKSIKNASKALAKQTKKLSSLKVHYRQIDKKVLAHFAQYAIL